MNEIWSSFHFFVSFFLSSLDVGHLITHHTSWKSYDNISLRVYLHPGPGVTPCHETLKSQNNWVAGDNKIFYYILTTNKGRWKSRKIRNLGETRDISRVDGVCRIFFPVTADLIFHAIIVVTAAFWTAQRVKRCCSQPGRGGCQTESAAIGPSTQLSLAHIAQLSTFIDNVPFLWLYF